MREVARAAAFVAALLVVCRDLAVAGVGPAMLSATVFVLVLTLGALTLWRDGLVTVSTLALVGHYALSLGLGDVSVDLAAPVVGAFVLLYADLADLATTVPGSRRIDRAFARHVTRDAALLLGGATLAGAITVAIAAAPWPSAEWIRAAGALGVGAVVVIPLILAWRAQ
jgi:hypothetical protein